MDQRAKVTQKRFYPWRQRKNQAYFESKERSERILWGIWERRKEKWDKFKERIKLASAIYWKTKDGCWLCEDND
jgi:hypothetical protein